MSTKRVILVSIGLAGLLVLSLWVPGIAQFPRVSRRVATLSEMIQQQAALDKLHQLPSPTLNAKALISEKNAGKAKEPAFNQVAPAASGSSKTGAPAKPAAQTNTLGKSAATGGAQNKDAAQPGAAKHTALPPGYHPNVNVLAPGRLDWTIVVSDQSLDPDAFAATAGYISTRQSYEFYAPPPPAHGPVRPYPLILSISTSPHSGSWGYFGPTCQKHGALFAGVHNAGNDVPMPLRARTVLDVLDDVRRRYPVDPDRTYVVGVSGAGHAAASIAHALPEVFGGLMAICGGWNLRLEPALRLRVAERISEAVMTGATDFNGPELRNEFFPILRHENIRSQLWVYPGMGHGCPGPAQLEQVFQWLEAGLPQRRLAGSVFPVSRLIGAPSSADWAAAVVQEGSRRLSIPGGEESGVLLLRHVVTRWGTQPAADAARGTLERF